ncbi:hypothetical protein [Bradyrhizobium mercantei]|uniref:hypothetical protein n=1 Tax=Bradyrhizobium mercantei TaxID=1904807 RepID=UPI000976AE41|nr:hypothetical protein [Bradyrhizobium mercantei]
MEYGAFSDASLKMMHEAVRGALQADDEFERRGDEPVFRVRTTAEWKRHAANLEDEMSRRGLQVDAIDWTSRQGELAL